MPSIEIQAEDPAWEAAIPDTGRLVTTLTDHAAAVLAAHGYARPASERPGGGTASGGSAARTPFSDADWAGAELTVRLTDDAEMRGLNAAYRGKDRPTNVLSFPGEDLMCAPGAGGPRGEPRHLGDLVLARETLMREAAAGNKTPADHFSHLVVHGLLHLLGYDHETDPEADRMEALEVTILARAGVANPYAAPTAPDALDAPGCEPSSPDGAGRDASARDDAMSDFCSTEARS